RVTAFVEQSRYQLVEALAEAVAKLVLDEFPVPWLRLSVNKQGRYAACATWVWSSSGTGWRTGMPRKLKNGVGVQSISDLSSSLNDCDPIFQFFARAGPSAMPVSGEGYASRSRNVFIERTDEDLSHPLPRRRFS
ncbi:MAG: dihydroneopterin aldolase, partial [Gammaproteobacteria bacterium]